MLIAVTGGSGFIGRSLVRSLVKAGHDIRILTRKPDCADRSPLGIQYFQGDLTTDTDLSTFLDGVDILFHCAGEILNPARMVELHIKGTERLAHAAAGRVKRWVQLSSTGVYGPRREGVVLETDDLKPIGLYETSKVRSDELVAQFSAQGAFDHVILRPSIVFGSEMPNQSLFAMLRMIENRFFFYIGRPGASANYIHVDNVVKALIECGLKDEAKGQVFNISDYCTIEVFIEMMANALQCKTSFLRLPENLVRKISWCLQSFERWPLKESRIDALTSFVRYPINKIERYCNYSHAVDMSDGVADIVRFYRDR